MSDPHETVTVIIFDTVTNTIFTSVNEYSAWWWAEGNGSCDCNREAYFDYPDCEYMDHNLYCPEKPWQRYCIGEYRYIIVHSDDPEFCVFEYNIGYDNKLIRLAVDSFKAGNFNMVDL